MRVDGVRGCRIVVALCMLISCAALVHAQQAVSPEPALTPVALADILVQADVDQR